MKCFKRGKSGDMRKASGFIKAIYIISVLLNIFINIIKFYVSIFIQNVSVFYQNVSIFIDFVSTFGQNGSVFESFLAKIT